MALDEKLLNELLLRNRIESFLYHEAELLDDWRFPEWASLFTDDARYDIASLDADDPLAADPATSLFVVSDDKERLVSRASRLMKKNAHSEYPRSKVRHLTSNIRFNERADGAIDVRSNFVVYRSRGDKTVRYMGEAHYELLRVDDGFRIRNKRIKLDLNTLADQGRLTIIL
ncbi:MAG: aromatic-ring-hydroxylating dioxygenase subunit beta [Porticoccaceae bacterium]